MKSEEPPRIYQGRGETLEKAFLDAACKAIEEDTERNRGRQFEVLRHFVTVDNPRISEYIVEIGG